MAEISPNAPPTPDAADPELLALVRYGLAKELRLYDDALELIEREEGETTRVALSSIRRLILQPGDRIPSKLIMLLELDDETVIIAAEGMTNVRDFRRMLPILQERAPHITLDPEDMSDQLAQAVANRRQTTFGCYGLILLSVVTIMLIFFAGYLLRHH